MTAEQFAAAIGLTFRDPALLAQALVHRSYCNEIEGGCADNERLEFLGDAVIDFIAGEMLYLDFPDLPEGDLTRLRASLVSEASLAAIGTAMEIGASLRMGRGEEGSGGRSRPSIVCAAVEAVIGALYIDSGMETARAFAVPLLRERLAQVQARSLDRDARSVLQERAQAALGFTPQYTVIAQTGPDHARQWTVQVQIGDRVAGQGMGHSKQAASQAAAHDALTRM